MAALKLGGQRQTGVDRQVVQDDGAGAALTLGAALLGAGQPQILPENVQQTALGVHLQGHRGVVDKKVQLHLNTPSW